MLQAAREGLFIVTAVAMLTSILVPLCALIVIGLQKARCLGEILLHNLNLAPQGVISLWTTVVHGRKHSGSSFELEVPSARAASRSDPTLMPIGLSEETTGESSMPV